MCQNHLERPPLEIQTQEVWMGIEICISNKFPGDADVQDDIFDNHWCVVVAVSSGEVWWSFPFSLWLELEFNQWLEVGIQGYI